MKPSTVQKPQPQLLRFEPKLGTDELNVAEFPLAAIAHRVDRDVKTLSFEDQIFDEGHQKTVQRKLIISASDHFGLPTPRDSDVLLVLLYLTNLRNGLTQRTVQFTRYELAKLLGWGQGGRSYRRLDESLNRWAGVTLYYNHAWWDRSGRKWRSRTFHVIESVELRGRGEADDEALSSCTWNDVLFGSLQANNFKRLDLELYFRLQNAAARQAYRFLDKRFYRARHLEFELRTFACEHVGFSRSYDTAQLKRRLQPAIEELEAVGFLEPLTEDRRYRKRGPGDWVITLGRAAADKTVDKAEPSSVAPLESQLIERGVSASRSREICGEFSAERITEKLQLVDWLIAKRDRRVAKNPPGFLIEAIRQDYPLPKELRPACRLRSVKSKNPSRLQAITTDAPPVIDDEFDRFWQSLDDATRTAHEQAAVAAADPFHAATLQRLRASGGELFASFRRELIAAHWRTMGRRTAGIGNDKPSTQAAAMNRGRDRP
ncbi:MAG: replication initiator protein A [Pirellulales bacterium]|nr:replication initiator protein A [Pirellulales bacterium]